jgi:hypothetical protein
MRKKYSNKCVKAHYLLVLFFLVLTGCNMGKKDGFNTEAFNFPINTTWITNDTIDFSNPKVSFINGIYYLNNKAYSGIVFKELKGFKVKTYSSVLNGKLHGKYQSFYENGKPYEIRNYKNNVSFGMQLGYWKSTGVLKFKYNYINDKKEGLQKSWYDNGELAYVYNFKNDKQDGLQQAWRKNRSLYRNYVVKNGGRYGLQKAKSCFELEDEKVVKRGLDNNQALANISARD